MDTGMDLGWTWDGYGNGHEDGRGDWGWTPPGVRGRERWHTASSPAVSPGALIALRDDQGGAPACQMTSDRRPTVSDDTYVDDWETREAPGDRDRNNASRRCSTSAVGPAVGIRHYISDIRHQTSHIETSYIRRY